jgi:hypothetical protein
MSDAEGKASAIFARQGGLQRRTRRQETPLVDFFNISEMRIGVLLKLLLLSVNKRGPDREIIF